MRGPVKEATPFQPGTNQYLLFDRVQEHGILLTLRELQSQTGNVVRRHDRDIRVGRDFKCGKTAGDDESADYKARKDRLGVGSADREFGDGPEEDGTNRVESETGNDGELVTAAFQDLGSDGRVAEVTTTEVGDWK